jgi:hypothetical protein
MVEVGPLAVFGPNLELLELSGDQCTLCGHLGIQIPQPWLVRMYPPDVRRITVGRRERLRMRREARPRRRPV